MKFFLLFLVIISSVVKFSNAQVSYEIRQAMDFFRTNKAMSGDWKKTLTEADIKGSPYAIDEFVVGTIYTIQKLQYVDIPMRYNIYNDQLEFKNPEGEVMAVAAPEVIETVELGNIKMVYQPYSVSKKIRKGYFSVIDKGKASLYLRQEIVFKEATEPGAYKEAEPAKFEKRPDEYFIQVGTSEAKLVDNKKDLLEAFPDKQGELEGFIKKNKIKPNSREDLIELVHFYNSL